MNGTVCAAIHAVWRAPRRSWAAVLLARMPLPKKESEMTAEKVLEMVGWP